VRHATISLPAKAQILCSLNPLSISIDKTRLHRLETVVTEKPLPGDLPKRLVAKLLTWRQDEKQDSMLLVFLRFVFESVLFLYLLTRISNVAKAANKYKCRA